MRKQEKKKKAEKKSPCVFALKGVGERRKKGFPHMHQGPLGVLKGGKSYRRKITVKNKIR